MERIFAGMLAVCGPAALGAHFLHAPDTLVFVLSALAVVPLAHYVGHATEALAHKVGAGLGSLLNASFGNAAELILAFAALRAGKTQMVKASITGSIIGNLLLILGLAMVAGGASRQTLKFNPTAALAGSSMMYLAIAAMAIPDLFHVALGELAEPRLIPLSIGISIVMLVVYALSLWFSIRTHPHLYTDEAEMQSEHPWSVKKAGLVLAAATAGTAVMAELLVHAAEGASVRLGLTETFVGVIVLAVVGNAAEHATAVVMAAKGKMDLAFNIAVESSKQIALFVAPVLVLVSLVAGPGPMNLEFTHLETVALGLSVGALTLAALDGETHWLEGVMLLALYAVLAVAFFFVP